MLSEKELTSMLQHINSIYYNGEEEPLLEDWFEKNKRGIRNVFFPVPNYNPPSLQQMIEIDSVVRKEILRGGQVLIHCGGGKGRAGSVISALLLKYGLNGIKNQILSGKRNGAFFTSEQVMKLVRDRRLFPFACLLISAIHAFLPKSS